MKICFFVDDITKVGGIERVTAILCNNLCNYPNLEINIVSVFHGRQEPNYFISNKVNIVYITSSTHGTKPHSFERIKNLIKSVPAIKRYFSSSNYDIIIAQAFPLALALFLSNEKRAHKIVVEHVYAEYYSPIIQYLRRYIYKHFKKVVVLTSKDKEFFDTQLSPLKVSVIPNPVQLKGGGMSALSSKKIISVGRLEYQKGFDTLIDCFKTIHTTHPGWILEIYGEGSLRDSLQQQIIRAKLESNVFLKGQTDDIPSKLKSAAFYVMSSHFEGFPMVLIEAMNQGLPCISFDCPNGPADIINSNINGILVENQNKEELIKAINSLINDPKLRTEFGKDAHRSIQRYDENNITQQWINLFNSLV